ncbi:3-deoxy-7-phosphoheptulonate synthase [Saccharothrix luteola]|uniref:3-deoxy-7-phosphoheptulonate synthase n=1 Tax=Saccharothrix luteola TaxID=2893018 RepID=UPI001E31A764|nr:3-deoxy-7-phosphoheptulonate synthase [Saccharothrix luteola]MCC8244967.1 3-deoxy-7-phosphoheptulonate synthase [Saccharothrix luteola]
MSGDARRLSEPFDFRFPAADLDQWKAFPAAQQPDWGDGWLVDKVRADLAGMPGLVRWSEVDALRDALADVSAGRAQVIQAGDCAEDPDECVPEVLGRKVGLLDALAGVMRVGSGKPVVQVGRIAGQFAKPRSQALERHGDVDLPVYRGPMVNSPEPVLSRRRADPLRMLVCYRAAGVAMDYLRRGPGTAPARPPVWASHEALVLDYEVPLLRHDGTGRLMLASTHWPWIGERTRDPDGAHVNLLAAVRNPVACKVGPLVTRSDLLALCERLDPDREPGRLALIARFGATSVADRLPAMVSAVRAAGHPVIWLCDPMHGNTVRAPNGRKTRLLDVLRREVREFRGAVLAGGGVPGGLHLETTPADVDECVTDESEVDRVGERLYTTLCDPRLNPEQAVAVASVWDRPPPVD